MGSAGRIRISGLRGWLAGRARRRRVAVAAGLLLIAAAPAGVLIERATRVDLARLDPPSSTIVRDRRGEMLRFVPDALGRRHVTARPDELPPVVRQAFLAAEDERFFDHRGVDARAVIRALKDNARARRIVSGASTLTQQLVRLSYPRRRTFSGKAIEAVRALRLERRLSKEEILCRYLNAAPVGNNLHGVETGARIYFGKGCASLTEAEAAVLASLPKAPGALNPYGPGCYRLLRRKDWVLGRMRDAGFLTPEAFERARSLPVNFRDRRFPMEASHAVDRVLEAGARGDVATTLDLGLQRRVEEIVLSHRPRLAYRGASQAAAVVLNTRTVDILALAGSISYGARDGGFNDGALALRSPGSTLKPFLYALALDSGLTAATVIEDVERRYRTPGGEYLPENFDRNRYGPVSMREALGNSLNLSAVNLLNRVGYESFYRTLTRIDLINFPERGPGYYGLGLVVGNPEVSLVELAAGFAALANGGSFRPAVLLSGARRPAGRAVFSAQAAYIVTDMLSDPKARDLTFGACRAMQFDYPVALKTGTSTRYRDCWAVGYTPDYTVGVWVGNFNGKPTWNLSGATAAAPILSDIMTELHRLADPRPFPRPPGVARATVCAHSGLRRAAGCPAVKAEFFIEGTEPQATCTYHAGRDSLHYVPTEFAGWLRDRFQAGQEGAYRLAGFAPDLSALFPEETPEGQGGAGDAPGPASPPVAARPLPAAGPDAPGPAGCTASADLAASPGPSRSRTRQGEVSIAYPLDGDRFIRDRTDPEMAVTLKASCSGAVSRLVWLVDGVEVGVAGPPYEITWPLAPGRHEIAAVNEGGTGDSIRISVE